MYPIIIIALLLSIFLILNILCIKFYCKISEFFNSKKFFTDFFFIGLFSIEQIIFLIIFFSYSEFSPLLIGLFSVIIITTSSLQKFLMDIKTKKLYEYNEKLDLKYKNLLRKYFRWKRISKRKKRN